MMMARWLVWFAMVLPISCALTGVTKGGDGAAYEVCSSPEGRSAWGEAQMAFANGDDATALAHLVVATRECPDFVRAHTEYQDLARRLGGAYEQAMVDFYMQMPERASEDASPVPAYMRARLADTAYAQANALDQILREHADFGWGYLSRGRVHRGQGRLSEALVDLDRAILADGGLMEARLERAQVLTELGRDEEAALEYKFCWDANPADLDAGREYLALLLYRLGRVSQAKVVLATLKLSDQSQSLQMDEAAVLWRDGKLEAAIETYLSVLAQEPRMARAALNIGLLYYEVLPKDDADKARHWPKALAAFELFMERSDPEDGYEQFERTWAVPFRMQRILARVGPLSTPPTLDMLRPPR
jgi:tetratricopeptide (TPR) repeat protein